MMKVRGMSRGIAFLVVSLLSHGAFAGDLTPPAGPIAPTMKNLTQVEPRTPISAATTPGDANTVFNITQPGSYYLTGDVLVPPGFSSGIDVFASRVTIDLNGFAIVGAPSTAVGILSEGTTTQITVRNGHISGVGTGLFLTNSTAVVVSDVTVSDCSGSGIQTGPNATVSRCVVRSTGSAGFVLSQGSVISNCTARGSATIGFTTSGQGVIFADCSAFQNGTFGFSVQGLNSLVRSCVASNNTLDGFVVASNSVIIGCTAGSNGAGVSEGAGIRLNGSDTRAEGNNCLDNDRGIEADAAGNFITRNTCSGNTTNWEIVAGNVCLVVNATTSGAISGSSGGAAPGSTDPNANFTY